MKDQPAIRSVERAAYDGMCSGSRTCTLGDGTGGRVELPITPPFFYSKF